MNKWIYRICPNVFQMVFPGEMASRTQQTLKNVTIGKQLQQLKPIWDASLMESLGTVTTYQLGEGRWKNHHSQLGDRQMMDYPLLG